MRKLILLIAVMFSHFAYSQFDKPRKNDLAVEFKKRILIVELEEYDEDKLKSLKRRHPEKVEAYKQEIDNFNEQLKKHLPGFWKLNEKIEFRTHEKLGEGIDAEQMKNYCIMTSRWAKWGPGTPSDVYVFRGFLLENSGNRYGHGTTEGQVFCIGFPSNQLSPGDLLFLSQVYNTYVSGFAAGGYPADSFNIDRNIELLQHKTMLFDKDNISAEFKYKISEYYPYPYKLADAEEIEKAIVEKNKNYCYITEFWDNKHSVFFYFGVNAEDGKIISKMGAAGFESADYVPSRSFRSIMPLLGKRQLKIIANPAAQSINNMIR